MQENKSVSLVSILVQFLYTTYTLTGVSGVYTFYNALPDFLSTPSGSLRFVANSDGVIFEGGRLNITLIYAQNVGELEFRNIEFRNWRSNNEMDGPIATWNIGKVTLANLHVHNNYADRNGALGIFGGVRELLLTDSLFEYNGGKSKNNVISYI